MNDNKNFSTLNLDQLYLDPNNYRFVDHEKYIKVEEKDICELNIQKRTLKFIEGEKKDNIKDLISSFVSNGFLDVDIIQVKKIEKDKYVVLEGNRRIATLKNLLEEYKNGMNIGNLNEENFNNIPVVIHEQEDKKKHLIVMGLKHIRGNKKWSPLNQAQLIHDFLSPFWGDSNSYQTHEKELCESLGIGRQTLRLTQRTYHLILDYRKSDYGDQFNSEDYSLFIEVMKKPVLKTWLNWNEEQYKAKNLENLERLFNWISTIETINEENEYDIRKPIITKAFEIRDLALFINNTKAIQTMIEEESVNKGLYESGELEKQSYEKAFSDLRNSIEKLNKFKGMISYEDIEDLREMQTSFSKVLPKKSTLDILEANYSVCFEFVSDNKHFEEINIKKYKIFNDFDIKNLNKINIFAGFNNSGKTSLLEAIFLLTKHNDISHFLKLQKLKNKVTSLNPNWLNHIFETGFSVEGIYNNINTKIKLNKFEATNIDKQDDYITSYKLSAFLEERELNNEIHTFEFNTIQRNNEKVEHLCNSSFKSPFFYDFEEVLQSYERSIIYKTKQGNLAIELIIKFIQKIDPKIKDIRLGTYGDLKRFIVDSSSNKYKNLDITNYGEGLQRVFELALSFSYSKNGVLFIDEFETAIHNDLLINFTLFIQELSELFNVQVFLSSHSKECIDAFVKNQYSNEKISAYYLENINGNIEYKYVKGDRLEYLVDSLNIDIRGERNL